MNRRSLRICIDIIFPPTPHERVLREYSFERFFQHFQPLPVGDVIALSKYHVPVIQAAVAACKFERNRRAAALLATLLVAWLKNNPAPGITILIPIPLSIKREKERGFNQVTRVLTHVPVTVALARETKLLIRTLDTTRQTSLGRRERLKNIQGAFTINNLESTRDWSGVTRVIICDDVVTTGTTLSEAAAIARSHLPPHIDVICIAFAH